MKIISRCLAFTFSIVIVSIGNSAYSNEVIGTNSQPVQSSRIMELPVDDNKTPKTDDHNIDDKPTSKSKPWAEMSAGERTGFILAIPIVIPAVAVVGAWDIAVGTIKILGPGSADMINKYR